MAENQQQLMARIRGHFRQVRETMHHIPVDEWGVDGKPLDIYVKPPTLEQLAEVDKYRELGRYHMMTALVVLQALDAEGERIFSKAVISEMMKKADSEVVGRIAIEIKTAFSSRPTAEEGEAEDGQGKA